MKTNPNDSANPTDAFKVVNDFGKMSNEKMLSGGLTKREHFAALALQGMLANSSIHYAGQEHIIVAKSIYWAEALIEELNKEKP